ncbi:peptidoglycan editing factor PgeF [Hydrogenobacter hydrogenophilus]|uniref:peptidoglycan editing factor PgeF n=1 Tax=Hydrogenobacter hydrogenophilus TaxID=35835 RepID=UPI001FE63F1C|nr:peptidoglycan editing factor PgeF [Hydrogenobacter hydrogenophilus]
MKIKVGNIYAGITKNSEGIFTLKQTHSDKVYLLERLTQELAEGDAIITQLRGVKIGVKTADCVPIALLGKHTVGVIHAGWRGLKGKIIENTIEMLKNFEKIDELTAFVGPSAKACCYQVGEEFKEHFICIHYKNGSFFLDTQEEAITKLKSLGIRRFIKLSSCSICNTKYPSYRRNKTKERLFTYAQIG